VPGVGKALEDALYLLEVVLAEVERVRLAVVAERQGVVGADVPFLQVARYDHLRDTSHYITPFGAGRA
jgi:hypothetical protein